MKKIEFICELNGMEITTEQTFPNDWHDEPFATKIFQNSVHCEANKHGQDGREPRTLFFSTLVYWIKRKLILN